VDVNYKIHVPEVGVKTKTKIIFVNWIESKTKIAVKTELEQKLKWINLELNKSKTKINLETKTSQISPFQLSLSLSHLSILHLPSLYTTVHIEGGGVQWVLPRRFWSKQKFVH